MKLIVAFCKNRGIGINNTLPWKLYGDMSMFKQLTIGGENNAVIMGRKTWLSLPVKNRPLPKRQNIVLTSKTSFGNIESSAKNPIFLPSLMEAKNYCEINKFDNVWVIGGSHVYKESLDKKLIDTIHATEIEKEYECDIFFPEIKDDFVLKKVSRVNVENDVVYNYKKYEKKI
jgi:dihydrofolate reductase